VAAVDDKGLRARHAYAFRSGEHARKRDVYGTRHVSRSEFGRRSYVEDHRGITPGDPVQQRHRRNCHLSHVLLSGTIACTREGPARSRVPAPAPLRPLARDRESAGSSSPTDPVRVPGGSLATLPSPDRFAPMRRQDSPGPQGSPDRGRLPAAPRRQLRAARSSVPRAQVSSS
jgi:hypothetical protein